MERERSLVENWLDASFFKTGAFLRLFETDEVILGKGTGDSQEAFQIKDFFTDHFDIYRPASFLRTSFQLLKEITSHWPHASFSPTGNTDHVYEDDFRSLEQSFGSDLQKVVLISRENYTSTSGEPRSALFAKTLSFGTGTPYGFWNTDYGIMGSTPEILFTKVGEELKTIALAGTAKYSEAKNLLESTKDRHEHQLVVDDIREKLIPFTETVFTSEIDLIAYKSLVHLKTDISAKLKSGIEGRMLASRLSPTAALGGYPQKSAVRFLQGSRYQKMFGSRFFGSCMGFTSPQLSQFLVMIRNVQWRGNNFFIESGGGVVPESVLAKEKEEIALKRQVIREHYL